MRLHLIHLAVSTLVVLLGGLVVRVLLRGVPRPAKPHSVAEKLWNQMTTASPGGYTVGVLERFVIVGALWSGASSLIAALLAFKVASKWEAWRNVVQFPAQIEGVSETDWFMARGALGSWLLTRFWIGTFSSLLGGLIAWYLGAHICTLLSGAC